MGAQDRDTAAPKTVRGSRSYEAQLTQVTPTQFGSMYKTGFLLFRIDRDN